MIKKFFRRKNKEKIDFLNLNLKDNELVGKNEEHFDEKKIVDTFFSIKKNEKNPYGMLKHIRDLQSKHKNIYDKVRNLEERMEFERTERERISQMIESYHADISKNTEKKGEFLCNNQKMKNTNIGTYVNKFEINDPEQFFITKDGKKIDSLLSLANSLKSMPSEVFSHHVNESKNDFSSWIYDVHNKKELSNEISKLKNRLEIIEALHDYLNIKI